MKKAVVVIVSLMIVSVMTAMGAIVMIDETALPSFFDGASAQEAQPQVWQDPKGRCSAEVLSGWQVLNQKQAEGLFLHAEGMNAATGEQTALLREWMHTGDTAMFVSPDRRSSIIISCRTMENALTDTYVANLRNRYAQQVEKKYEHITSVSESDTTFVQTGSRLSGVRCDNLHPSGWMLGMQNASTHVFFTYKGRNLYTIIISDASQQNNAQVHSTLFSSLNLA